ncbi:hypothetical protein [Streptomyces sp. NPDC051993]|uniref:hypothetical protein n=1 Tax=Streptomyces sp. NPDC051993 TaxID=3155286 RepID=UPI00341AC934
MTTHPAPALKSLPAHADRPERADSCGPLDGGAAKDGARRASASACPPGAAYGDGRRIVALLHIVAPRGTTPTARSRCSCGRDRTAIGRARVLDLITDHAVHRTECPLLTAQEGRNTA